MACFPDILPPLAEGLELSGDLVSLVGWGLFIAFAYVRQKQKRAGRRATAPAAESAEAPVVRRRRPAAATRPAVRIPTTPPPPPPPADPVNDDPKVQGRRGETHILDVSAPPSGLILPRLHAMNICFIAWPSTPFPNLRSGQHPRTLPLPLHQRTGLQQAVLSSEILRRPYS